MVCEREDKSVISVCKNAQNVLQMHFMAFKKSRRTSSVFVIYSYFKDGELTAVKRNTLLTRYVKGVPFVKNEI